MKTLILATVSAVALLAAGAASAQAVPYPGLVNAENASKSSQVRQNGVSNTAAVDQTSATTGWSYIFQGGPNGSSNSSASLTQNNSGSGSRSVILQDDVTAADNATAGVTTAGKNGAAVTQSGSNQESGIEQRGGTNYANTRQSGNGDGVTVLKQVNVTTPPGQSEQTIAPATYLAAADGAFVDQIGNGNYSDLNQAGINNLAVVQQTGDLNSAMTNQQNDSFDSSKIEQSADTDPKAKSGVGALSNSANVDQQSGSHNTSVVTQRGITNSATVKEYFGSYNTSFATQNGTSNSVQVTQTGSSNTSGIQQGGDLNTKATNFGGSVRNDYAIVNQTGYSNASNVNQGANNNSANVDQAGQFSTSVVNQGAAPAFFGGSNFTGSEGTGNYAGVKQTSGAYQAFSQVDQRSTNNTANVLQAAYADVSVIQQSTGNSHVADVSQNSARAYSLVQQSGASNYSVVKQ